MRLHRPEFLRAHHIHGIAGSGGTFGLPAVSQTAHPLDLAVPGRDETAILSAIDALEASIRHAGR